MQMHLKCKGGLRTTWDPAYRWSTSTPAYAGAGIYLGKKLFKYVTERAPLFVVLVSHLRSETISAIASF